LFQNSRPVKQLKVLVVMIMACESCVYGLAGTVA